MSDVLTGNASNITTPLQAVIASAIAGSGITTCTTTTAHLFGNNDLVYIAGATGMTGLNATWTITVTGSTTFTVPSALSGSYGANTAIAQDYSLTPQILVPTDGDTFSAQLSGLLSSQQSTLDRTQFLQTEISTLIHNTYRLYAVTTVGNTGYPGSFGGEFFSSAGWGSANNFSNGNAQTLTSVAAQALDIIEVTFYGIGYVSTTATSSSGATAAMAFILEYTENGGSLTAMANSMVSLASPAIGINSPYGLTFYTAPFTVTATRVVSGTGTWVLSINGCNGESPVAGGVVALSSTYNCVVKQYRPNSL